MSQSVGGNHCACCVHWHGRREDKSYMSSGTVLAESSQSKCSNRDASLNDYSHDVGATHSCPAFERWTMK